MKENKTSMTSLLSAFGRAYHSKYSTPVMFDDFLAQDLISEKEHSDICDHLIQGISFFSKDMAQELQDKPDDILKWVIQVQLSPTPLARAAYCEKVLLNEMRLGVKQYVILGAGLDTFCFRHPEVSNGLDIFEIDHYASQEDKINRLKRLDFDIPSHLHFVPMDFAASLSFSRLYQEGFSRQKTFFSLLGVSYYLTKKHLARLLTQLFDQVPPGSSIVFDYADQSLFEEKGLSNRVENMVKMAAASGEPMLSCFSYEEIEKVLESSGLLIYEHLSPAAVNERFFSGRTDYLTAFETIHFIHAVKK
ncbi:putative S-adenosyl-L-methionine-dependent methyltransferase YktD [Bacillus amyloliquefaciens]|uniref:class I SAM-dependent methyltransferase n=1 Tax=Bacillus amyloliquefaciens TaxID=1390 RepID=UPI00080C6F30|nr:class I SAM-dependent methyltransferase [Bacillus amyloliquefaciens]OCB95123.1 putative S-adenosyl-L-methionine-dependent methyltransferase YktD [Bacillus amyloliquefaciens]